MTTPATVIQPHGSYQALAKVWDRLTASYKYDLWLSRLHQLALGNGASGNRLLDAACGTGRSFEPMLSRGYQVTGCDISSAMVECAREKLSGHGGQLHVTDMRSLPALGSFDLITCLDDAINHLLEPGDVTAAFESFARRLRCGGVLIFDVNALFAYRTACSFTVPVNGTEYKLCRSAAGGMQPGSSYTWRVEAKAIGKESVTTKPEVIGYYPQRHWPIPVLKEKLIQAGFDPVSIYGQSTGAKMATTADDLRNNKIVFVAKLLKGRG